MEFNRFMRTPKHGTAPKGSIGTFLLLIAAALGLMVVAILAAALAGRGWLERRLSEALLHELSLATGERCAAEPISVGLRGQLSVRQLRCGDALTSESADVGIDWWATIRSLEPQLWLRVRGAVVDLSALAAPRKGEPAKEKAPIAVPAPLRSIRLAVECETVRLRLAYGDYPADLSLGDVTLDTHVAFGNPVRVRARVTGKQVRWKRGGHDVALDSVGAQLNWAEGQPLYLMEARLLGPSADLWFRSKEAGQGRVQGVLEARVLAAFVEDVPPIGGQLRVLGSLLGSLDDPTVDLLLRLDDGVWNRLTNARLRARFVRRGTALGFSSVRLHHAAGFVAGDVGFDLDKPAQLRVDGRAALREPVEVLRILGIETPLRQLDRVAGHFELGGVLEPLALEWTANGRVAVQLVPEAGAAALPLDWTAKGKFTEHDGEVVGSARSRDTIHAQVEHRWSKSRFGGTAEVEVTDLRGIAAYVGQAVRQLGLSGAVRAASQWSNHPREELRVSANAREITVLGDALRDFECTATLQGATQWEIGPCRGRDRTGGAVGIEGTWNLADENRRRWKVEAEQVSAEVLAGVAAAATGVVLPISRGRVNGSVEFRGAPASGMVANVEVLQFRLYREPISLLRIELANERGHWQLASELARRDGAERLTLRARGQGERIEEAVLRGDAIALSGIVGLGQHGAQGNVEVSGEWSGPLWSPLGDLRVTGRALRFRDLQVGDAELQIAFQRDVWQGRLESFGGRLQATVQVLPRSPYPFEVRLSVADLTVEPSNGQRFQVNVTARSEASGRLWPWQLQRADVWAERLVVVRDPYQLAAATPVHASFDGVRFQLEPVELVSAGSRVRIAGGGSVSGNWNFALDGSLDLKLFELLGPPLLEVDGVANVGARVSRDESGGWHGEGSVVWSNGTLEIEGLPPLANVNFTAKLVNQELRDAVLNAEAGGGHLRLSGSAHALHGPAVEWHLEEVAAMWVEDVEARVSGRGTISGPWDNVVVAGDIRVENAVYDRNLALGDLLRWLQERLFAPRQVVERRERSPVALNLQIYSPGNVYVDNNIAKVEFWLDLWVRGNAADPLVGGRIGVLDGEVNVQGRTFAVTGGAIEFRDPASRTPWLQLSAETRIRSAQGEYQIGVLVTGQADRPRIQFSADDPSLTPDDIVSLIAIGRTRSAVGSGGFSPAGAALALLPKREAEERIQRWLAVDRFEVSATQARDTGAVEPRVTIGKELSERLYASVWTSVGAQSRQAVQLEYRVTRRVSLLGTWESGTAETAGAFGGDVKFRMEFLRAPFSLLCP